MDYQSIINEIYVRVTQEVDQGQVASYIPELSKVDPGYFGIYLTTVNNQEFGTGNCYESFSIQSIAKVFSLCLAYKMLGPDLWKRLGVEPSGTAFNSLTQLESDLGIPRNPFINAGALVICDVLISLLDKPKQAFLEFMRKVSDVPDLAYATDIAESEKMTGYRNIALCNFIKSFGNIENDTDEVADFYFNLCSIKMNCKELSRAFLFLANNGNKISSNDKILNLSQTKRINAIMQTCGFYDESGEFSYRVGLPGKSGVGGGIIAIRPNMYSIAVWSPKLNEKGNSCRGMKFLEHFTTKTESSIF